MAQMTPEQSVLLVGGVALFAWLLARSTQAAAASSSSSSSPVRGVSTGEGTGPVFTYTDPIATPLQRALPGDLGVLTMADRADVLRVLQAQLALLGFAQADVYAAGSAFLAARRYNRPLNQTEGQYLAWLASKVDEAVRASRGLPAPTGRY